VIVLFETGGSAIAGVLGLYRVRFKGGVKYFLATANAYPSASDTQIQKFDLKGSLVGRKASQYSSVGFLAIYFILAICPCSEQFLVAVLQSSSN
jgi:hypothetical protein